MSQLVRLEGKHSTQNAHCAVQVEEEGLKVDWTKLKAKTSFDISRWFADLLISDQ